jgi:thioredoxin-dependent peroxiredoxin
MPMMKKALWIGGLAATIVGGLFAAKPSVAAELKAGDAAPDFTLPGTDGKTYSLAGLKGQSVVLAWFPKAFTAG